MLTPPRLHRRLSELSAEAQNAPRVSKDHADRALQYMEFKARAEAALLAEMELVKTVRHFHGHALSVCARMRSPGALPQLERQLKEAKQAYANAMSSLDDISKEIHMKRAQSAASLAAAEEHAAAAAPGPNGAAAAGALEEKTA